MADLERIDNLGSERPPDVRLSQEVWDYCRELAKEYNLPPLDVANRLMMAGMRLAKLEEERKATLKQIIDEFSYWEERYKTQHGFAPEISAFKQALHPTFLKQFSSWDRDTAYEIVSYFGENHPASFKEWCKETNEGILGVRLEEDKRVLSILAIARREERLQSQKK